RARKDIPTASVRCRTRRSAAVLRTTGASPGNSLQTAQEYSFRAQVCPFAVWSWATRVPHARRQMSSTTSNVGLSVSTPGAFGVLVGRIGEQRFALPADAIVRILPMAALTPLAEAPRGVAGLLNLGGEVLAVI